MSILFFSFGNSFSMIGLEDIDKRLFKEAVMTNNTVRVYMLLLEREVLM